MLRYLVQAAAQRLIGREGSIVKSRPVDVTLCARFQINAAWVKFRSSLQQILGWRHIRHRHGVFGYLQDSVLDRSVENGTGRRIRALRKGGDREQQKARRKFKMSINSHRYIL